MADEHNALFGPREDWWHNACLNFATDDWDLYCYGFRQAADFLVERIVETKTWQDSLVFPIIFLYRQYLELRLKILIRDTSRLLDADASIPHGHKIEVLWNRARAQLLQVEEDKDGALNIVNEVVEEFAALDPTSTTFRYPVDKKGENPLANLRYINIAKFRERFELAAGVLEGASGMVCQYLEHKWEMEREYLGDQ